MSRVTILPEHIANKIAAGEVVERPASVVKELVENSIDAESTRITISIQNAGKTEIKIVDNGTGMTRDDALLALERHATSKITRSEDLENIVTLGFRGEALPSIASVSRLKMITRTKSEDAGVQLTVEGGVLKDVREVGAPPGTTMIVRNLFFNTPARKKFLRTNQTEMNHISEHVVRLALAHPGIHFKLTHQGRTIYEFTPTENLFSRVSQVFGVKIFSAGQTFLKEHGGIQISGFVAPPEINRATSNNIYTFVNNRYIKDTLLNRTIIKAYQGMLPKDRFPMALAMIALPPREVDVNVHPTKSEVRFRNVSLVLRVLQEAIHEALSKLQKKGWDRPLVVSDPETKPIATWKETPSRYVHTNTGSLWDSISRGKHQRKEEGFLHFPEHPASNSIATSEDVFSSLQVIGQLGDSYILCEAPDGLVIIDQHAAHERIIYDSLKKKSGQAHTLSQVLLAPQPIELLPNEANMLREMLPYLDSIGLHVEPFGGNTFVVKSIPACFEEEDPNELINDLLSEALSDGWIKNEKPDLAIKIRQSMACKAAVKANSRLSGEEITELLKKLDKTENPATCPHGRPLWWKITNEEIAKFFKRGKSPI